MARRAAAEVAAKIKATADAHRPALSFRDWCSETSPRLTWEWPHLVLLQELWERCDPRAPADPTPVGLPSFPHLIYPRVIKRLQLSVPPRHGKSEQITIRGPAWRLERDPALRYLIGGYSQTLAEKFSRRARGLCRGRVALSADRNTAADWETTAEGGVRAIGVGSGVTGHGADWIIVDDPTKSRAEAESPTYRNRVWDWYTDDLYTRLEPQGGITLIQTRWHYDDLSGRVERSEEGQSGDWVRINLPALAEINDLLGRPEGAALAPGRYDVAALERIRRAVGGSWISLYQGRPTPAEGALLRRGWFRRYSAAPLNPIRIVQSWDCAQSDDPTADYSVGTTWAETALGYYLLDVRRERLTYPALKRAVVVERDRWRPATLLIEKKSHGAALIQDLRADRTWRTPVVEIIPVDSKVVRMAVESAAVEAGLVWLPEDGGAPWLAEYLDELIRFPAGANDDQVDSTSQYLHWVRVGASRGAGYEWLEVRGL
ncbi:phage terminase large subunit [uncultured Thiodictyon sp.]|uniref:phage terminase large subunit n=1 Tax=uncultured Thiodictyon sp. TaxID=1846217 RepID=UPI0025E8A8CC|nr:phage terminase large subunit [uncultured Thiodictyon sp.]